MKSGIDVRLALGGQAGRAPSPNIVVAERPLDEMG